MSKYNLSSLKQKISPRDKDEIEMHAADRFIKADETLGMAIATVTAEEEIQLPKSMARVVRKTFSIPESELYLFEHIKDRALNRKVVLAESEVIRLGLLVASELSEADLEKSAIRLEKMPMGRPPKQSKVN